MLRTAALFADVASILFAIKRFVRVTLIKEGAAGNRSERQHRFSGYGRSYCFGKFVFFHRVEVDLGVGNLKAQLGPVNC
jgi:hypothetical protein